MASGAVFTDGGSPSGTTAFQTGGSLQVGHPQARRQARNGRWYTEEEFRRYYEKAWRSYWDGAGRETVPLCASQPVSSQRARRSASATELPSTHVAPPASSVVHAAEPAAALVAPGASTGAHAVEPAAAPATPGASTKAPAAETAAAPVAPGASRPGLSEGAKPNSAGKYAAAGPAAGLATLGASTVVHAAEPAVAPVSSEASTEADAVELKGQAVAEARELKPVSSDGTPGAAASLAAPGASQIGPLLSDGGAVSVSTGGAAERADPDVRLRPCPPKTPPPAYLLARQSS